MMKMRIPGSYPMRKSKIRLTLAPKRYVVHKAKTNIHAAHGLLDICRQTESPCILYQQLTSFTLPVKDDYVSMQKLGEMEQGVDDHEEGEINSQPGQVTPEEQTYEACT